MDRDHDRRRTRRIREALFPVAAASGWTAIRMLVLWRLSYEWKFPQTRSDWIMVGGPVWVCRFAYEYSYAGPGWSRVRGGWR